MAEAVERTPTHHSRTLSKIAGCEIYLKFENLQFTASFKERGALNKLLSLSDEERQRGVVAMSAGNHAQGVAYHAGRLGIPATIVMPEGTPFNKVKHTKGFGARVVIDGPTLTQAFARALSIAQNEGLTLVHPYDDAKIIAGQGTVALELLQDVPDVDALVVPIGGGGLISGIAIAAKAIKPQIEIYGVQARLYPSMYDAVKGARSALRRPDHRRRHRRQGTGRADEEDRRRAGQGRAARARGRDRARHRQPARNRKDRGRRRRAPPPMPPSPPIASCSPARRSG